MLITFLSSCSLSTSLPKYPLPLTANETRASSTASFPSQLFPLVAETSTGHRTRSCSADKSFPIDLHASARLNAAVCLIAQRCDAKCIFVMSIISTKCSLIAPVPPVFSDHVLSKTSLTDFSGSCLPTKRKGSTSTDNALNRSVALVMLAIVLRMCESPRTYCSQIAHTISPARARDFSSSPSKYSFFACDTRPRIFSSLAIRQR